MSDNGLEQGGIMQIILAVLRKWAMIKDSETRRFTSETDEKLSQSILMLNMALKEVLLCIYT